MDLNSLPKNASSLKFSKFDQNVMGLCLSYKVNLGLSLRKTAHALHEIHGIKISHQQVANCLKTAAVCVKPFVDNYDYCKCQYKNVGFISYKRVGKPTCLYDIF